MFIKPEYARQGIGRTLHDLMLNWYFDQGKDEVWLGTTPGTRAEHFYRQAGWTAAGTHGKGEIRFEMNRTQWMHRRD